MANCTGFQIGISTAAEKLYADKKIKNILVIGAFAIKVFKLEESRGLYVFW